VETHGGEGPWGNASAEESGPVPCFIEDSVGLTRTATGDSVSTTATLWVVDKAHWEKFTPESIVHLPAGRLPARDATVFSASPADSGDLDLPDHLKVVLT
jgi:hypothetical protein